MIADNDYTSTGFSERKHGQFYGDGFKSHTISFFTVPIVSIFLIAALDNADKQLLSSSFPMIEKSLGLDIKTLGNFSLFGNLSYALAMPFWAAVVHWYGLHSLHKILSLACLIWGLCTIGIAITGHSYYCQAILRSINGAALASILPLSQTVLVDLVHPSMLGRAFGFMSMCEKTAGTLASIVWCDEWEYPYYVVGCFSILMALVVFRNLRKEKKRKLDDERQEQNRLTMTQTMRRILKMPTFSCLIAQGMFGGTPWDMMSFVLLLLNWRGFQKYQMIIIQFTTGISGTIGGWIGGNLGDYFALRYPSNGRIYVAFFSVAMSIPLYGSFLYATTYESVLFWYNLFFFVATWPPAAACRPICAQLAKNPSERAQIIAMWIFLEKFSNSIFGAPLVGYLTSNMIASDTTDDSVRDQYLADNLFFLSSFFWMICAICWLIMAFTVGSLKHNGNNEYEGRFDKDVSNKIFGMI